MSQGDRDGRGPERPRPRDPPAQAHAPTASSSASPGTRRSTTSATAWGGSSARAGPAPWAGTRAIPAAFSYSHLLWRKGFLDCIGSPHAYGAGSQDVNNRFAASALLYGTPLAVPIPDIERTDFLFMVGANPLVSHGSVLSAPRVRERLLEIEARGGRVVCVDPRRSETARQFEHQPIRPDGDAWLLLSMLHTIFEEGLADTGFLDRARAGLAASCERFAADHPPEATEASRPASRPSECASWPATSPAPSRPPPTGARGPAWAASPRWSPSCSTRSTSSPGTSTGPGAACSATRPIALDELGERIGLATYGEGPRPLRRLPRRAGRAAGVAAAAGDHHAGRAPDPRAVRVRRQPGAVGARRRRARGGARASST